MSPGFDEMILRGEIEVFSEKPDPVPLRQLQTHIDLPGVQPLPLR